MQHVFIPRLAPTQVANLRYSRHVAKYGLPSARVTIGGVVSITFESPLELLTRGAHCPPATLRLLLACVPGFKRVRRLGQKS